MGFRCPPQTSQRSRIKVSIIANFTMYVNLFCSNIFDTVVAFGTGTTPSTYVSTMFADFISTLARQHVTDLWSFISEIISSHSSCLAEGPLYFIQRFQDVEIRVIGLNKGPNLLWGMGQALLHCGNCNAVKGVEFQVKTRGQYAYAQSKCKSCKATSSLLAPPATEVKPINNNSSAVMWHRYPITSKFLKFLSDTMKLPDNAARSMSAAIGGQATVTAAVRVTENPNCCMYCSYPKPLLRCCRCGGGCCHTVTSKSVFSKYGCIDTKSVLDVYTNLELFVCPECLRHSKEVIKVSHNNKWLNIY